MSIALSALVIWRQGLMFCPGWPGTWILPISASHIAWNDRLAPLCPDTDWDEVSWTFCQGWPPTKILPISASQVSHWTPALIIFEIGSFFLLPLAWILIFLCMFPTVASMTTQVFSVELGYCQLFPLAGLQLQSSQSQPPE
jgi:hypothetical protein